MKDFKTANTGKRVVINPASYKEVKELKKVILQVIEKHPLGLKLLGQTNNVMEKQIDFSQLLDFIKNIVIGMDTSEEVENALFSCLRHCTYDTTKVINEELFDEVIEAREDQYEIFVACIEENLTPFIKSLVSMWNTLAPKLGNSQALATILTSLT